MFLHIDSLFIYMFTQIVKPVSTICLCLRVCVLRWVFDADRSGASSALACFTLEPTRVRFVFAIAIVTWQSYRAICSHSKCPTERGVDRQPRGRDQALRKCELNWLDEHHSAYIFDYIYINIRKHAFISFFGLILCLHLYCVVFMIALTVSSSSRVSPWFIVKCSFRPCVIMFSSSKLLGCYPTNAYSHEYIIYLYIFCYTIFVSGLQVGRLGTRMTKVRIVTSDLLCGGTFCVW